MVIIGNGLAGAWALGAHWLPALRTRALWWFTVLAEAAIFVQAGLGVALVNVEKIDPPQFHLFYGFVAIIAVGSCTRTRRRRRGSVIACTSCTAEEACS